MAGEITGFTGIDAPYEAPEQPEVWIRTGEISVEDAVEKIMNRLGLTGR